jgi:alpha-D-ribose 1-methylphosphonate 5-phosphate C-P lyase
MRKKIKKERKVCIFCGAKRYVGNMYFCNHKTGGQWACKNNDLCVLKASYNKKKKKI